MHNSAESSDIFETKTTPKPTDANIFNQKVKEFYTAPQTTNVNNQAINQEPKNQSINKKRFHLNKKITIIICLFVFLGALSAGAYYFLNQKVSTKELVNLMKANLVEAKSLHYIGQIILNNDFSLNLNFNGNVDNFDKQNEKSAVLINAVISSGLMKLSPELELRTFGKEKYLRIKIENLPFIEQLSPLNNQWLMIDLEALKKFIPTNVNINSDNNQEITNQTNNLIKQTNFFKNLEELDSEIINDKNNRHLTFELDNQELKNFFINISTLYDNKLNAAQLGAIDKNLAKTPLIKGEMWIDSEDYNLTKIIIPLAFEEGSEKFTLEIKFELSNYNVPANIVVPEQYKTLEEVQKIIEEQVSSYYDAPKSSTQDSDYDGLKDEMEEIYGTNPKNSDSDNDGYNDGEEVQNGYNPLGTGKL